ncbi:MAG: hypothetical protein ACXWUG_20675 [Polyangiales bacterium]
MRSFLPTLTAALVMMSAAPSVNALPRIGSKPRSFVVKDVDDRAYQTSTLTARTPTLLLYVDKDGCEQNAHLKARLEKLRQSDAAVRSVKFIPIVDLAQYNAWPKRGFAVSAIRDESRTLGLPIYADWDAAGRASLSAKSGQSNLFVLDKSGVVAWASAGQLSPSQEDAVIETLRLVAR